MIQVRNLLNIHCDFHFYQFLRKNSTTILLFIQLLQKKQKKNRKNFFSFSLSSKSSHKIIVVNLNRSRRVITDLTQKIEIAFSRCLLFLRAAVNFLMEDFPSSVNMAKSYTSLINSVWKLCLVRQLKQFLFQKIYLRFMTLHKIHRQNTG